MPSPFPGMDPYLEAPDIWPDFHDAFAGEIRAELNRILPEPYYARLEMRQELGIVEEAGGTHRVVPDISVVRSPHKTEVRTQVSVLERPRSQISESVMLTVSSDPIRHQFIEIRDPNRGHHLITLIEMISPSNKSHGPDRRSYLRKKRELIESDANLIELDLLREGERLVYDIELEHYLEQLQPQLHYLILLNRAWRREETMMAYELFTLRLQDILPCIPVPLLKDIPDVGLDLQWVFNHAYERGPYRRGAVDYTQPPSPSLKQEEENKWLNQLLIEQQLRQS